MATARQALSYIWPELDASSRARAGKMMVASFLACDFPKVSGKLDMLWPPLSRALVGGDDVPRGLVRGGELDELWCNQSLFVSQR